MASSLMKSRTSSGAKPNKPSSAATIQGVQKNGKFTNVLYNTAKKKGPLGSR